MVGSLISHAEYNGLNKLLKGIDTVSKVIALLDKYELNTEHLVAVKGVLELKVVVLFEEEKK